MLVTLACVLAVFSTGQSASSEPNTPYILVGGVLAGSVIGQAMATLLKGKWAENLDGWLLALAAIVIVFQTRQLNSMLPGGGFEFQIIIVATLSFILIIGSAFAWRDGTMLFLTLPCLALFGLVGTFDTYAPSTMLFFAFLLATAVLYSRTHQRTMLERAQRLGASDFRQLGRGPWRWMAGPEWALLSGGVIIAISLLGAPVIQKSVEQVSPEIRVAIPDPPQQGRQEPQGQSVLQEYRIGRGPIGALDERELFRVRMRGPSYLREQYFTRYNGRGWDRETLFAADYIGAPAGVAQSAPMAAAVVPSAPSPNPTPGMSTGTPSFAVLDSGDEPDRPRREQTRMESVQARPAERRASNETELEAEEVSEVPTPRVSSESSDFSALSVHFEPTQGGELVFQNGRGFPAFEAILDPDLVLVEFRIVTPNHSALYSPGVPVEILLPSLNSRVRATESGQVIAGSGGWAVGETVRHIAALAGQPTPDSRALMPGDIPPPAQYAVVNTNRIPNSVAQLADRVTAGIESDYERARAIQREIATRVRYNLNVRTTPENRDPIEYFLFESREGYCDLYASAMVMMARHVGLPARFMIGYLVQDPPESDGFQSVQGRHYHAWAEIYFEGLGWVIFDATEGTVEVPGAGIGDTERIRNPWLTAAFLERVAFILLGALVVFAVGYLILSRGASTDAGFVKNPQLAAILKINHQLQVAIERFTHRPRRFSETMPEYLHEVQEALGEHYVGALALARDLDRGLFGRALPEPTAIQEMKARADAIKQQLHEAKKRKPT